MCLTSSRRFRRSVVSCSHPNRSLQLTAQSAAALRPATELRRCTAVGLCCGRALKSASKSQTVAEPLPAFLCVSSLSVQLAPFCRPAFPLAVIRGKFEFGNSFFWLVGLCGPLASLAENQTMQFTYNEALQLTAQSAGALWVPSAAFGRSGVN